jgi:hypothetical protein
MGIRAKFVRARAALRAPRARGLLVEIHANPMSLRAARACRDAGEHCVQQQRESHARERAIVAHHDERSCRRARAQGDGRRLSAGRAASRRERSHRVHEELSGRRRVGTAGLELHLAAGVLHGTLRIEIRQPLRPDEAAFLQASRACCATSSARGPSHPSWRSRSSRAQVIPTVARTRRLRRRRRPPQAPRSMSARQRARLLVSRRPAVPSPRPRRRLRLRWRARVLKVSREEA